VASVTAYDAAAALLDPTHVAVTGSISALSGEGSLTLTWDDPSVMEMGNYRCVVNGIDARGHHTEMTAELTMTSVTPTVLDLIDDIKHKMNGNQNSLQHEIDLLKQENGQQKKEIDTLQLELQQKNSHSEQEIALLKDQIKRCSDSVAFHAYMKYPWDVDSGETVQFKQTISNYGGGYNSTTGIFVAPRPGLYFFNCNAMCYTSKEVRLYMKVNSGIVSSLYAGMDHDNKDSATMTATVHLNKGDQVRVVANGASVFRSNTYVNVFSGHLLHADDCRKR